MKQLTILSLLFLVISCKSTIQTSNKYKGVQITFEQGGELIKASKGSITLKKEAFNVILDAPKSMDLFISASHNDSIFKLSLEGKTPDVFESKNVIAVDLFNKEKTIYLSDYSANACYYVSEDEHTFNQVKLTNLTYRGTRTIANINTQDTAAITKVEQMMEPVYLVFAGVNFAQEEPSTPFLLGKYLKIEWE